MLGNFILNALSVKMFNMNRNKEDEEVNLISI